MGILSHTKYNAVGLNFATLILRVSAGGFMLTHGWPKLQNLISGELAFPDPLGISSGVSLILAVFAEFLCALLVVLGLRTRLAVVPLIVTMVIAAFVVHGADPFGKKEMSLLYLSSYVALLLTGSGRFSFDYLLGRK